MFEMNPQSSDYTRSAAQLPEFGRQDEGAECDYTRLEEQLRPIVRLALRKGVGIPEVVGWVRRAQARLAGERPPDFAEQYSAEVTRMLTATLLDRRLSRQRSDPRCAETTIGI